MAPSVPAGSSRHQEEEAQDDDALMRAAVNDIDGLNDLVANLDDPGEKAEGAIDYADIDDDDLAEDEDEARASMPGQPHFDLLPAHGRDNVRGDGLNGIKLEDGLGADNLDDLFGDVPSSPTNERHAAHHETVAAAYDFEEDEIFGEPIGPVQDGSFPIFGTGHDIISAGDEANEGLFGPGSQDEPVSEELLQQQELFARSRAAFHYRDLPAPTPENEEEALALMWPKFEKNSLPKFMELMPPKKARYVGKIPMKPPKPPQLTKVNLEIEADQEKSFKVSAGLQKRKYDLQRDSGLTPILTQDASEDDADEEEVDSDYENNLIGGKSWRDLQVICADWDLESPRDVSMASSDEDDLFGDSMVGDHAMSNPSKVCCQPIPRRTSLTSS